MSSPLYRDASLSIDQRVTDLLGRMTLDEKLAQIGCVWSTSLLSADGTLDEKRAADKLANGTGHVTRIGGGTVLRPEASARFANSIQRFLVERTRLGVPAIIHEESCAGYLARDATCFPQAIGLASTWEPRLVEAMTEVVREQMRAVGAHQSLAPVLDVARDPRWGRTEETFGEDPYLIAQMGVAYVRGLQGADLARGIAATGKHFLGYGASEGGMNWAPAHLGWREIREVYALPFEAAIREARLATMMNAYNEIDGVPAGGSTELLTDLLRGELGFDGPVVSDYFTVATLAQYHRTAGGEAEAARQALEAGLDVELPALHCFGAPLKEAIERGEIDIALVDRAAARLLKLKFQLGLFERPYVDAERAPEVFETPAQRELARQLARKSIVLLKNDAAGPTLRPAQPALLPLPKTLRSVAVIGPNADSVRNVQGDYHYPSHLEIMFGPIVEGDRSPRPEGAVNLALHFPPTVTVREAIRAVLDGAAELHFAPGCDVIDPSTSGFAAAVEAARRAEVAIVVVGDRAGLVEGCTSGESVDRADLCLPGVQQQLVEAVVASGTPTVVVLINGRPLAIPWIAANTAAIVEAWLPGQEAGNAVADVLFGDYNPGGKLPISLPVSVGQVPVFYNHKPSGGRSHWKGPYSDSTASPLFPFGHGLSFTTFAYDGLEIAPARLEANDTFTVRARITNSGDRRGDEVVQLYVHDVIASVTRPVLELKAFHRLALEPGESKTVTFTVAASQLAFYDRHRAFVVEPGEVEILVGSSSADIRLRGSIEIGGETTGVAARRRFRSDVAVG